MDPISALGAAGSVVGIASFGLQLSKVLIQFTLQVATAQEDLRMVLEGIQATSCALDQVHGFLAEECKNLKDKHQAILFSPKAINDVKSIADKCLTVFWRVEGAIANQSTDPKFEDELKERLNLFNQQLCSDTREQTLQLRIPDPIILSAWRKICWPYIAPKLGQYSSQLHYLQNNLVLIFSVISVGAQRLKPGRNDEDLRRLVDLYAIARHLAYQTDFYHNTVAFGQSSRRNPPTEIDRRDTAQSTSGNPERAGLENYHAIRTRGLDNSRRTNTSSKSQVRSSESDRDNLTGPSTGIPKGSRNPRRPIRVRESIAEPRLDTSVYLPGMDRRAQGSVRSDLTKEIVDQPPQSSNEAIQHGPVAQQPLGVVTEHDVEPPISVHSPTSLTRSQTWRSRSRSISSGSDSRAEGGAKRETRDAPVMNGSLASSQEPQNTTDADIHRQERGSLDSDQEPGPKIIHQPFVKGGVAVKPEHDYAAYEVFEAVPDEHENKVRPDTSKKDSVITNRWTEFASAANSGQVRSHQATSQHDEKPQTISSGNRRKFSQRKSDPRAEAISTHDPLSKASLERNRDTDASTNAGSEQYEPSPNTSRQKDEYSVPSVVSSKQPRRFSSFVKGVFVGPDSDPDSIIRCYVIKLGEAHEVPHSGSLKLTRSLKRNADMQPSHQSWYKVFAFMGPEDRAALQKTTGNTSTENRCTIIDLKKLRENTVKFWDKSNPAYFAILKGASSTTPVVVNETRFMEPSSPEQTLPKTWGIDVPLPKAPLRGRDSEVGSDATLPINSTRNKLRQESVQIQDITAANTLGEAGCLEKLTTFGFFSMRRAVAPNPDATPTWERIEIVDERLSQADILQQINKLSKGALALGEKKMALHRFQRDQVTWLLDDLAGKETDPRFRWELAQLDQFGDNQKLNKERSVDPDNITILVFVRRSPRPELSAVHLYTELHQLRNKAFIAQPPSPPLPPKRHPQQKKPGFAKEDAPNRRRSRGLILNLSDSDSLLESTDLDSDAISESVPIKPKRKTNRSSPTTRRQPPETRVRSRHDPGQRYETNVGQSSTSYPKDYEPFYGFASSTAGKEDMPDSFENPFIPRKPMNRHPPDETAGRPLATHSSEQSRPPPVSRNHRHPVPAPPSSVDPAEDYPGYGRGFPLPQSSADPKYGSYFQPPYNSQPSNYPQNPWASQQTYAPSSYYLPGRSGQYVSPYGETVPPPPNPGYFAAGGDEQRQIGMHLPSMEPPSQASLFNSNRSNAGRQYSSYPQYYDNKRFDPMSTQTNNGEYIDESGNDIVQKLLLEWTPGNAERSASPPIDKHIKSPYEKFRNPNPDEISEKAKKEPRRRLVTERLPSRDNSRRATVDDAVEEGDERDTESTSSESTSSWVYDEEEEEEEEEEEDTDDKKEGTTEQENATANSQKISDARTDTSPKPMSRAPTTEALPKDTPSWLDPSYAQSVVDSTSIREYGLGPSYPQPSSTPGYYSPLRHHDESMDRRPEFHERKAHFERPDFLRDEGRNRPPDRANSGPESRRPISLERRFDGSESIKQPKGVERRATSDAAWGFSKPSQRRPLRTRSPADMGW